MSAVPKAIENLVPREQLLRCHLMSGDPPLQFGSLFGGNLGRHVGRNAIPQGLDYA
jgi:hypothetical protein